MNNLFCPTSKAAFVICTAAAMATVSNVVQADKLVIGEASVPFEATTTFDIGGVMKMEGELHYDSGKSRRTTQNPVTGEVLTISRPDLGKVWTLNEEKKSYTEAKYSSDDAAGAIDFGDDVTVITHEKVGSANLLGRDVTKHKVIVQRKDGVKEGGFYWKDDDNIVLKYAFVFVREGEKQKIQYEMTSLKTGDQPSSLFEVPSDYKKGGGFGMLTNIGAVTSNIFGGQERPTELASENEKEPHPTQDSADSASVAQASTGEDDSDPFAGLDDELIYDPMADAAKQTIKETVYEETRNAVKEGLKSLFD